MKFSIALDDDIYALIEDLREVKRQSRSQWIKEAILKNMPISELNKLKRRAK